MLELLRIPHAMEGVLASLDEQRLEEERMDRELQELGPVQVAEVNSCGKEQLVDGWLSDKANDFTVEPDPPMDFFRRDEDGVNTNFKEN
jgi:hypothetical protein